MGNRNSRPHQGLTTDKSALDGEEQVVLGLKQQALVDPGLSLPLGRNQAPSCGPITTLVDNQHRSDNSSHDRNCLVTPSHSTTTTATTTTTTTTTTSVSNNCKRNDSSNSGLPPRALFSASLERSLSSRKQSSVLLRSCSSWTAGHDAATRSTAVATKRLAFSSADNINTIATQIAGPEEGNIDSVGITIQRQKRGGQSDPNRNIQDTVEYTEQNKDSDKQCKGVLRGRHQDPPRVRQEGTEKIANRQCQPIASGPAATKRPPPITVSDRPREPSSEARKDNPARRGTLRSRENPPQQGGIRGRYITTARRGGRGRGVESSMVKCWEGGIAEKAEGRRGDEEQSRVGRVVKRRGGEEAEVQRSRRRPTENSKTSIAEVGGRKRGGRRDDNSRVIGTGHGRAAAESGPALSDEIARFRRQHGKKGRGAGGQTAHHDDGDDTAMNDDERSGRLSSLQQLPSTTEDGNDCESLSVSSANSLVAQELSVSSLPPMGTATMATDLIFEESSFEDSGASISLASSPDRSRLDGASSGASGVVGESCGGGREKRSPAPRQRRVSSDGSERTRSVGRGLSTLMARIREQQECGGVTKSTREAVVTGHRGSSDRDSLRVQDLLDSDNEALEALSASVSSTSAAVPWAVAAANSTINVGHERAALELRNLTLEREVEQLKTHLRSMGGEDVDDNQRRGMCRPRPRQQRVAGERALAGAAAAGAAAAATTTVVGGMTSSALSARKGNTTTVPATISAPTRRSVAPLPLAEIASPSISHRGGGAGSIGGGGGGDTTGRRKVEIGRATRLQNCRGGRDSTGSGTSTRHVAAFGEYGGSSSASGPSAHAAPSPPRKRYHRSSDARPLATGVSGGATALTTINASSSSTASPRRQLRSARLRSPDSATSSEVVGTGPDRVRLGGAAVGPAPLLERKGKAGAGRTTVHGRSLDAAGLHHKEREADDKSGSELGRVTARESPRAGSEARPLPRLRGEEAERRQGGQGKSRAGEAPIYLGGVMSGIKHTLLGRRRSTGAMNLQLVAPAGSTTVRENGGRRGKDKGRPLRSQAVVDNSNIPLCTDATATIKETTGNTMGDRDDTNDGKSMLSSRQPARQGKDHSRSSSMATTNIDAVGTTTANERHQRRGRGTETLSRGGPAAGVGGGQEKVEGRLTVVRVKQARGDNARGLSSATRTNAATAPHESPPPATEVADERQEAVAAAVTIGTNSVSVAETSATAAVPATVTDITSALTKQEAAYERWPAALDARWAEVEFMLCHEVESEESLRLTTEATQAGLVFMEKLEKKAQELGVLKGQLSRWLLPYNADTSVEEQQAATPRRLQESLQASVAASSAEAAGGDGGGGGGGGDTLTEQEAEYLTTGARRVRQLVRLKIADDNDLNTAKEALITMAGFFVSISEEAATRGGSATAFSVLQERRAMSPITRPPPLPSIPRPPAAMSSTAISSSSSPSPSQAAAPAAAPAAASASVSATTATTPNATTASIERNSDSSQASGGGRMAVSPAAPTATMASAPGEGVLPKGEKKAIRSADLTAVAGGEARQRTGDGVSLPPATATTATKAPRRVDPAAEDNATGTTARGETSLTAMGTAKAHAGAPVDSWANPSHRKSPRDWDNTIADVAEAGANSGGGGALRKIGGGSTGGPPSRLLKGATAAAAAAAAAAAVCDAGRVEHSPRYGSTGEVTGVAPPGSLERLKRRARQARSRSTTQR